MRSSSILCGMIVLLSSGAVRAESGTPEREAAERYARAMRLIDQRAFAEALRELEQAYALRPHPQVLYNIGAAHAALGQPSRAAEAFERLLSGEDAVSAELRRRADEKLREQLSLSGTVVMESAVPGAIKFDGREGGTPPVTRRLDPGTHSVVFEPRDAPPRRFEIQVRAGETVRILVDVIPTAPPSLSSAVAEPVSPPAAPVPSCVPAAPVERTRWRSSAKVGLVLTAALAASTIGLYAWNQGRWSEWRQARSSLTQAPPSDAAGQLDWDRQRQDLNGRLSSIQTVDRIALGLGAATLVAGAVTTWLAWPTTAPAPSLAVSKTGFAGSLAVSF